MTAEGTVSLSFRVTPGFARLLERVAALERRSKTNLVETLVLQFCQPKGIAVEGLVATRRAGYVSSTRQPRGA